MRQIRLGVISRRTLGTKMKKNVTHFLRELSFEEKKALVLSFLEFTLRNTQFEVENDLTDFTQDQIEPLLLELRDQISKVEALTESSRKDGLSETIKDFLATLRRGQRENTTRRLNYSLKKTLPAALFFKLYDFVGIPPEDLVLDNALFPSSP